MDYYVESHYANHTSGTKFYGTISITASNERSVAIFHWGGIRGAHRKPRKDGWIKVVPRTSSKGAARECENQRRKKETPHDGGAYTGWKQVQSDTYNSPEEIRSFIKRHFKDEDIPTIIAALSLDSVYEEESALPTTASEPVKEAIPSHAEWGVW